MSQPPKLMSQAPAPTWVRQAMNPGLSGIIKMGEDHGKEKDTCVPKVFIKFKPQANNIHLRPPVCDLQGPWILPPPNLPNIPFYGILSVRRGPYCAYHQEPLFFCPLPGYLVLEALLKSRPACSREPILAGPGLGGLPSPAFPCPWDPTVDPSLWHVLGPWTCCRLVFPAS